MSSQENHAMLYNIVFIRTPISVINTTCRLIMSKLIAVAVIRATLITRFDNKYNHSSNKYS